MWLNALEIIFKIVLVLTMGLVAIVYIACKYITVEPPKEEKKQIKQKIRK